MTNIEWLQSIKKEKAIEFIDGLCLKHKDGCCKNCELESDADYCEAYTKGINDFGRWLFEEHDKTKDGE